ncbi:hypothetical protein I4U23_028683 [Adineta vaga]|nr:hypothetical protein I4U23_028683 [Adineta vaga]
MAVALNQTSLFHIIPNSSDQDDWYPYNPDHRPPTYYIILQGVCAPLIIIISTVLNSLIAVVLLQKHLRSPTNLLLLALALYDTLTGLFPFPSYIYVFTFQNCNDYLPFNYGWFHRINCEVLPFMFHTCSIWVTVVLAIQRYIYVCHSEKAKQWCTVAMALKAVIVVNILALIVAIPMFLEGSFYPSPVHSKIDPKISFDACRVIDRSRDPAYSTYYSIYYVLRALLINIGPCTVLVILNAILVQRMKEAKQNRDRLIVKRSHEARAQEQTSVTLMLVIVVTLFLTVEIPMALHLIISGVVKILDIHSIAEFLDISAQLLNFAVLLSYPINFFIYCRMSRAFRDAFTKLLCPAINQTRQSRLPSTTQLLSKSHHNNNFELSKTNFETKHTDIGIHPSPTVILNSPTAETSMSTTPLHTNNDGKKDSIVSLSKQHHLFRDTIDSTTHAKSTDL